MTVRLGNLERSQQRTDEDTAPEFSGSRRRTVLHTPFRKHRHAWRHHFEFVLPKKA